MIAGLPLSFAEPAAAAGPAEPAVAVVAVAGDAAAAAAHRVSADPAVVRHRAQGRNPLAHAVVADRDPPRRRRAHYSGGRRTDLESADRRRRRIACAAGDPARRRLERGLELGCKGKGRGRIDRQCRQRPARRRPGSAVRAHPRHHDHAGRHGARGVAPARAKALFDRAGRNPALDRALSEGDRRLRDRLAVGWRRYRSRRGISRRPEQDRRRSSR